MSTLILVFHPHLQNGSRVNARLIAELKAQGEEDITIRDEYAEYPNFAVNADHEHELLEAADSVILQFPLYWYSSPRPAEGVGGSGHHRRMGLWWRPRTARQGTQTGGHHWLRCHQISERRRIRPYYG